MRKVGLLIMVYGLIVLLLPFTLILRDSDQSGQSIPLYSFPFTIVPKEQYQFIENYEGWSIYNWDQKFFAVGTSQMTGCFDNLSSVHNEIENQNRIYN